MIYTVQRLHTLRPGTSLVYYCGDFSRDIPNSAGAPDYAAMLSQIRKCANDLAVAGKVRLSERRRQITVTMKTKPWADPLVVVTEYVAEAVAAA